MVTHGDAREEKWRGKRRMEWVASSLQLDSEHSPSSTRQNWHPRRYKWTRPFRWKTESGFCACAVTFHFHCTSDQRVAEAATYKTHNRHNRRIAMPSAGLEPATPAIKRPRTYRLTGSAYVLLTEYYYCSNQEGWDGRVIYRLWDIRA